MTRLLVLLGLLMATPAQATTPISLSLVDCAVLIDTSNRWYPDRRTTANGAILTYAAAQMRDAAHVRLATEEPNPHQVLGAFEAARTAFWDAKGAILPRTEEFRERLGACRTLANVEGIKLLP